jgi:prevent-host-death family protein
VVKRISQRELRNDSGKLMRELDRGKSYIVTRNGVPVGELRPVRRRSFVPVDTVVAAFRTAPPVERERFRADLDRWIDQDWSIRG